MDYKNDEKEVTLLEKIVRSHPIWYLHHCTRSAANHLLRPMSHGVCFFDVFS